MDDRVQLYFSSVELGFFQCLSPARYVFMLQEPCLCDSSQSTAAVCYKELRQGDRFSPVLSPGGLESNDYPLPLWVLTLRRTDVG